MNDMWHGLAEGLRTEVAEYGRLVQIFEEQQAAPAQARGRGRLRTTNEIDQQVRIVAESRRAREATTRGFAGHRASRRTHHPFAHAGCSGRGAPAD